MLLSKPSSRSQQVDLNDLEALTQHHAQRIDEAREKANAALILPELRNPMDRELGLAGQTRRAFRNPPRPCLPRRTIAVNVDQIYQLHRDEAFADQFCLDDYKTFVAMPFNNRGGYPEDRIKDLLDGVHLKANELLKASRTSIHARTTFSKLRRVDEGIGGALVITDEIIQAILKCHFFFGDLTGCNFGVVLETGIALALKPNPRVLLFTQDDVSSMHFDLKVTNVNKYRENTLVEHLANCLVAAAEVFEKEVDLYIRQITARLTTDAITALKLYGRFWAEGQDVSKRPSLWEESAAQNSKLFQGDLGRVLFHNTARELLQHRLIWNQYVTAVDVDWYGMHCTSLGWRVIEFIWKDYPEMQQHRDAPTRAF